MAGIPPLNSEVLSAVEKLAAKPEVRAAFTEAERDVDRAMREQIELCEIEAPTFHEENRARRVAELMRTYGLKDVVIDPIGNVVGRRPGRGNGPVLALGAHMDSVFPAGTDVKVRQEGRIYHAPGIGDNCSGLRALLQILRMYEDNHIETEGDLLFVGTVGEEGNGDIRGAKALFDGSRQIDGFIALDMADVNTVQNGATGAHRWRVAIEGTGGHSYLDYGMVPSAIHAMGRALNVIADFDPPTDPKTTFTVGTIKGGTTVNTIAARCEVDVDMRSVNLEELDLLEKKTLDAFRLGVELENKRWPKAGLERQLKLVLTQIGNRPAGMQPDDSPAVQAALCAMKQMDLEVKQCRPSSTDANKPISIGVPSVCIGTGGVTHNEHSLKEFFDSTGMEKGPQLALLTTLALVGIDGVSMPMLPKLG